MDDAGEVDLEAAVAMLPDELKDTIGKSITKCGVISKYTSHKFLNYCS